MTATRSCYALLIVVGLSVLTLPASEVALFPAKDNTLIQWSATTLGANPQRSNGLGDIFVGRTNQDGQEPATISIRRGLIQFDVASAAIPAGATITAVSLIMRDEMGLNGDPEVTLHRMLRDWGEGTSFFNGGQGIAATDGDATWLYTSFNADDPASSETWDSPGASTEGVDFNASVSASAVVFDDLGGGQLFTWTGPDMIADVQGWLANPESNFGWMLRGDETRGQSAKRLNSGESANPPSLKIEYILAGDYNSDGVVDAADYVVWQKLIGTATALENEVATPGEVTDEDYNVWFANFGQTLSVAGGAREVPEPASALLIAVVTAVVARPRWSRRRVKQFMNF